jgi:hypothetical protein
MENGPHFARVQIAAHFFFKKGPIFHIPQAEVSRDPDFSRAPHSINPFHD